MELIATIKTCARYLQHSAVVLPCGVVDAQSWFAQDPDWSLLFDDNFQAKPALEGLANGLTGQ